MAVIDLVRAEINKADPIGLIALGATVDEYDPEVKIIVKQISKQRNLAEFEEIIFVAFTDMFGVKIAEDREKYKKVALKIFDFLD